MMKKTKNFILYHGTNSERLKGILKSSAILPSSVTGIFINGVEGDDGEVGFVPSKNANGVYLGNEKVAEQYGESAAFAEEIMPAFGVVIKVEVDKNKLLPDMDDLGKDYKFSNIMEPWEESYLKLGQCVHEGEIPLNQIHGVRFVNDLNCVVPDEDYRFGDYLVNEVKKHLNKWYSIEEMVDIIIEMENYVKYQKSNI